MSASTIAAPVNGFTDYGYSNVPLDVYKNSEYCIIL